MFLSFDSPFWFMLLSSFQNKIVFAVICILFVICLVQCILYLLFILNILILYFIVISTVKAFLKTYIEKYGYDQSVIFKYSKWMWNIHDAFNLNISFTHFNLIYSGETCLQERVAINSTSVNHWQILWKENTVVCFCIIYSNHIRVSYICQFQFIFYITISTDQ